MRHYDAIIQQNCLLWATFDYFELLLRPFVCSKGARRVAGRIYWGPYHCPENVEKMCSYKRKPFKHFIILLSTSLVFELKSWLINILFPEFADHNGLHCQVTPLRRPTTTGSLAELVVDMVLTQPINWDLVVSNVTASLPCYMLSMLAREPAIECAFSLQNIAVDKRSDLNNLLSDTKQEPIAIVGMAVNMPGAPNVDRIWEIQMVVTLFVRCVLDSSCHWAFADLTDF